MIDFNWTELFFLAVIAVIFFGPEKLPEFARKAARVLAYLRRVGDDARGQLRAELGPEFDDIRLSDLNPKNFVSRHLLSAEDKTDLLAIRDEFKSASDAVNDSVSEVREGVQASVGATASDEVRVVNFDIEAT